MGLDASIPLQVKPIEVTPPINLLAQGLQIQAAQNQNALADVQLQAHQRTLDKQNALSSIAKASVNPETGEFDPKAYKSGLIKGGFHDEVIALDKSLLEQDATRAKIGADKAKAQQAALEKSRDDLKARQRVLGSLTLKPQVTHEDIAGGMKYLVDNGHMTTEQAMDAMSRVPTDPAELPAFVKNAFTQTLDLEHQMPKYDRFDSGGEVQFTRQSFGQAPEVVSVVKKTAAPQQATFRDKDTGSEIITYRVDNGVQTEVGRIKKSATPGEIMNYNAKMAEIKAGGKPPPGYRWVGDGNLEAIPGGPGDPKVKDSGPPTEFQGKSAVFGARAEQADKILRNLEGEGVLNTGLVKSVGSSVPFIGEGIGSTINALPEVLGGPSSKQQRTEQARRDFVNAIMRQESGAAIGPSEFDNASKQYFPQPGDSKETIAQKARNRQIAIEGLKRNAGKAAFSASDVLPQTPAQNQPAPAKQGKPKSDTVSNPFNNGWTIKEVK